MNEMELNKKNQLPFKIEVLVDIVKSKSKGDVSAKFIGRVETGFKLYVIDDNNAYYLINKTNDRPALFKSINAMYNTLKQLDISEFNVVVNEVK